jgi:hypothetical protein
MMSAAIAHIDVLQILHIKRLNIGHDLNLAQKQVLRFKVVVIL